MRRGFGFGADGKPVPSSSTGGRPGPGTSSTLVSACLKYECRKGNLISFLNENYFTFRTEQVVVQ